MDSRRLGMRLLKAEVRRWSSGSSFGVLSALLCSAVHGSRTNASFVGAQRLPADPRAGAVDRIYVRPAHAIHCPRAPVSSSSRPAAAEMRCPLVSTAQGGLGRAAHCSRHCAVVTGPTITRPHAAAAAAAARGTLGWPSACGARVHRHAREGLHDMSCICIDYGV